MVQHHFCKVAFFVGSSPTRSFMKFTKEQLDLILEKLNQGYTFPNIAKELNVNSKDVKNVVYFKLKLKASSFPNYGERNYFNCLYCQKKVNFLYSSKKKFCTQSCAASFNNKSRKKAEAKKCINCEKILSRRHSQKYCSNKCQQSFLSRLKFEQWKAGIEKGWSGQTRQLSNFVRRYMLEKYNFACVKCGWNKRHPADNLPLVEINHIDGNAENCKEDNLEVICPNCHAETLNFRSRNKNSKRER